MAVTPSSTGQDQRPEMTESQTSPTANSHTFFGTWLAPPRIHFIVLGAFVLLVCLLHLPLILNMDTHVIGRPFEDAFEVLWQLSWMDTALFDEGVNPFYAPDVYYPQGWYTASGAQPSWFLLLLAPATHLLGPTITFNAAMLGTFIFAGFGVYLLVYSRITKPLAALIAGLAYISAPILTVRLGGHLNVLIGATFLPYATLCLDHALMEQNRRWRWIVLAAISLALTMLGQWYFVFIAVLPLTGYFITVTSSIDLRHRLATGVVILGLSLIIVAPFAYLTWDARSQTYPDGAEFSSEYVDQFGLSPDYLFAGNPSHPLWGDLSRTLFPLRGEQDVVAMGYGVLVLVVLGLIGNPWSKTRPYIAVALIAFLLAMGMSLHWQTERILLPVGPAVEKIFKNVIATGLVSPEGYIAIPMPGLVLYQFLPMLSAMRVFARFAISLMLALAVLAGFGADFLLQRGRLARVGAFALGLAIVFEGLVAPYQDFSTVAANHRLVDDWLAKQPLGATLIEYPRPVVNKNAMYSQSLHGKSTVNGFMSVEPAFLSQADEKLGTWPDEGAIEQLREWDVRYMILNGLATDSAFMEQIVPETKELPGVCLVKVFDDSFMNFDRTYLFEIVPASEECDEAEDLSL